MVDRIGNEPYGPGLLAIAREHLEINSFERTGQKMADIRTLRISDIAKALEHAYKMGLGVGYNVAERERSPFEAVATMSPPECTVTALK